MAAGHKHQILLNSLHFLHTVCMFYLHMDLCSSGTPVFTQSSITCMWGWLQSLCFSEVCAGVKAVLCGSHFVLPCKTHGLRCQLMSLWTPSGLTTARLQSTFITKMFFFCLICFFFLPWSILRMAPVDPCEHKLYAEEPCFLWCSLWQLPSRHQLSHWSCLCNYCLLALKVSADLTSVSNVWMS